MRSAVAPRICGRNGTAIAAVVATIAGGFLFAGPADRARAAAGPMKESMEAAINDELHDVERDNAGGAAGAMRVAADMYCDE